MNKNRGETDLRRLLAELQPALRPETYIFCSLPALPGAWRELEPFAVIRETEGWTLIIPATRATAAGIEYDTCFRCIILTVHSSLIGVGLTAAASGALAERGISVNVVAAFYHDHLFVPADQAGLALEALLSLSAPASS
ncbi:MAG: ACT domain-containing protein [Desulfofustis sp.]|jgi:hypothetical protein|nr:ACT domain-containing protein [Desulfofustis sp.]